jgi:Family of unknown function (DUF6297)
MTAAPGVAPGVAPRVAAVRSFIRSRQHRQWFDWYSIVFVVVLVVILLSDFLAKPFSRLAAPPGGAVSAQAEAGTAVVIAAAAGLVMLAQEFGPLALSPADAAWLLLSPLDRRGVLRRPAATAAVSAAVAGAVLGVLALAMAGPYLRHGAHHVSWAWLVLAAGSGAGFFLSAVGAAALAQPRRRGRSRLRAACAAVGVAAMLGAVAGVHWTAMSRAVTTWLGGISTPALDVLTTVAVAAAGTLSLLVWRMLPRFPAAVLRTDSARAGTTRMAAVFLNVPLLTWIAEDNHWRGRLLASRAWPRLSPAFALAWADWRRLARRPALLAVLAASALAPALAGEAVTGHARGLTVAAALLAGAIAAGTQGTAATRRDTNDPTLRRLLGVDARAALAARAVLPALLSATWLAVALAILVLVGVLPGWLWPLLGPAAGPGAAAAALRIARTGPINPADQGPETPLGSAPPWLITRAFSVLLGLAGCYPALKAVLAGQVHGGTLAAQVAVSAIVLGGYLLFAASSRPAP